jgi:hypothetical protein
MFALRALTAHAALALLGGWCEAARVTTSTILRPQGGQSLAKDGAGVEFVAYRFDVSVPADGFLSLECKRKALATCKPGSSLGIMLENNALCWVIAQARSDFVETTGMIGFRGSDAAVLPIVNAPATGISPLFVFDVMPPTASPSKAPSAKPTASPSKAPSAKPSEQPSAKPSAQPSAQPNAQPTPFPTLQPIIDVAPPPSALPTTEAKSLVNVGTVAGVAFVSIAGAVLAAWRFRPNRRSVEPPSATVANGW